MKPEGAREKKHCLRIFCFLILSVLWIGELKSQGLMGSLHLEMAVFGIQKGAGMSYLTRSNWEYGVFYQFGHPIAMETSREGYPFYGVVIKGPILSSEKLSFNGGLKTGIVNQQFFIVTPELETMILLNRRFQWGFSMGYRARHPSIGTRLAFRFF